MPKLVKRIKSIGLNCRNLVKLKNLHKWNSKRFLELYGILDAISYSMEPEKTSVATMLPPENTSQKYKY